MFKNYNANYNIQLSPTKLLAVIQYFVSLADTSKLSDLCQNQCDRETYSAAHQWKNHLETFSDHPLLRTALIYWYA